MNTTKHHWVVKKILNHVKIFNSGFMNQAAKYCLPFSGLPWTDDAWNRKMRSLPKNLVGSWTKARRNPRVLDFLCISFRPRIINVLCQKQPTVLSESFWNYRNSNRKDLERFQEGREGGPRELQAGLPHLDHWEGDGAANSGIHFQGH